MNHDIKQLLYVDYYKEEKNTDILKIINSNESKITNPYKFDNNQNIINMDFKSSISKYRYDLLIIETQFEFFSLILSDSNDHINIRNQKISNIKPKKLKFSPGTQIFVQNFNSERVVANFDINKILNIYNIFSLEEPMISYNLSDLYHSNKINKNFDIINFLFYEKLIMIMTREIKERDIRKSNCDEYNSDKTYEENKKGIY